MGGTGNGHTYNGRSAEQIDGVIRSGWLGGGPAQEIADALGVPRKLIGFHVGNLKLPARDHLCRIIPGSIAVWGLPEKNGRH